MKREIMRYHFKFLSILGLLCIIVMKSNAQGVAVNTTGAPADSAAIFDVTSTDKGILLPRMLETQRVSITPLTPAQKGLLVYQTDAPEGFYYWDGTAWIMLTAGVLLADTSKWEILGNNIYNKNSGNVGIGTATPTTQLHTTGTVRFAGAGTPDAGKVLTSDANGTATWENTGAGLTAGAGISISTNTITNTGVITASNGLTVASNDVKLGGALTAATTIAQAANKLAFTATAVDAFSVDGTTFSVDAANDRVGIGTSAPTQKLDVDGQVRIRGGAPGANKVLTSDVSGNATWENTGAGLTAGTGISISTNTINNTGVLSFSAGTTGLTPVAATAGDVTLAGTLNATNGGTGRTTLTANNLLVGDGTNPVNFIAPGTSGNVLVSNGTSWSSGTGSGEFIQNQNATDQTANFRITGTGRANTSFQSPIYTRADAGTLSIRPYANATTAIQLQDATGTSILNVDATNSRVGIGTAAPTTQLHTTGTVLFAGAGTPGTGKVLTSDANGNATWENVNPSSHTHETLTRGTGLTGANYNGATAATWAVDFGTTAGTVAEGNHTHNNMTIGSGAINKVAFWLDANTLSYNTNFHWDNTNARLGIGTSTPTQAKLVVNGSVNQTEIGAAYYSDGSSNNPENAQRPYSIYASHYVRASGLKLVSDLRVKNINTYPDAHENLEKINKFKVANYFYKDSISKGRILETGFIAQEVEKVLPQAVSKNIDFIPDIYALSQVIENDKSTGIISIHLNKAHSLQAGNEVRFILENGEYKEVNVNQILSDTAFTVADWGYDNDKIFVFGKKVDDFRTIDYNQVFAVGIGAIQELDKKVTQLQNELQEQKNINAKVNTRLEMLEAKLKEPAKSAQMTTNDYK